MNRTRMLLATLLLVLSPLLSAREAREIDWLELMPPEDVAALEAMPSIIHEGGAPDVPQTTGTVAALDGTYGKLAGYIVPVTVTDDNRLAEFFLVPYFGACIHVPPPPPNQIVFVAPEKPIEMTEIWAPYWVIGTVQIEKTANAMAESVYSMDLDRVEPWEG